MRVTFDSNTWEKVVAPDEYPNDPKIESFCLVHNAVRAGLISGFICETFATLEAIRKGDRAPYLRKRSEDVVKVNWHRSTRSEQTGGHVMHATIEIGGTSTAHPGLHPVPAKRLQQAIALGFKLIPTSRMGTARPAEIVNEAYRIPLTDQQKADIWGFLQHIADITEAIESRRVGFSVVKELSQRIQARNNLPDQPWFTGLDKPVDSAERRAIDRAFAEWADGDTVAMHIAYGLDAICTEDRGKSTHASVFNSDNRDWLEKTYGVYFLGIDALANCFAQGE